MKVGFIGLGRMGYALVPHLLHNQVELIVYCIQPAAVERLVTQGAVCATTVQELARCVDVVFTMLPGPKQARAVVLGDLGVLSGLRTGAFLVELSTIDTDTVDELGRAAREKGVRFADAPVGRLAVHADRVSRYSCLAPQRQTALSLMPCC